MKRFLLAVLVLSIVFIGCSKQDVAGGSAAAPKLSVAEFMTKSGDYAGNDITLTGTVVHVCKHGGKKMFLMGENPDDRVKVTASEDLGFFDVSLEGNMVEVIGTVDQMVVDEAVLCSMEEDMKHQDGMEEQSGNQEQIDALRNQMVEEGAERLEFYSVSGKAVKVLDTENI